MDDLRVASALETAGLIARRTVSRAEVLEAAIARATVARGLGAIVTETFERARGERGEGVFAGVPTAIKDLAHVKGVRTRWGSEASGDYVAKKDDPFVARLVATGLVSLGKSATPELGLTATTEPAGQAPCRNPWDAARSTGGSSGGAAALVAAGVVPIAHASDGGGSIRIPAACCGLVGLKPSRGAVDMDGSNLLPVNIAVNGVLTRDVADTAAFYDALGLFPAAPVKRPLRIGMFATSPVGGVIDGEVAAAVRAAGRLCESLGHHVEEIACPFPTSILDDFLQYWGFVAWIQVKTARLLMTRKFDASRLDAWTRGMIGTFRAGATFGAIRRLRAFARTYASFFAERDVLLSPTLAQPAPLLGYLDARASFATAYDRLREYCPFTAVHNVAGAPAISLPLAATQSGLPIGIQFAAAPRADRLLLSLAAALEAARPWPRLAPLSA